MFKKPGLLVFVLTILQVSARYKSVEPDSIDNVINSESVESRIVSGWEAEPGQHPHHAALHIVNSTGILRLCGGSIISKEWIVTIARCVVNCDHAIVRVGVVSISDNNPENIFLTTEWYIHPEWDPLSTVTLQSHGVALIKLQRPLVYSSLIKPIRLQSSADADRDYDGEQVYASGHGRTSSTGSDSDVLRWVYLRAISNTECRNAYTSGVFNTTICARFFNVTSQSTCNNDRGGPLVHVESDGIPTLVGISYFFPGGTCESGRPSGYYRPGAFLSWFKEVTGIDFENLQEEDENDTTVADTTVTNTTVADTTVTNTTLADTTTVTVPTDITNPTTTFTPTTTTIVSTSTDSEDQDLEEFTPEENTTTPTDIEESEKEENLESPQISKRRTVNVNVKVLTNIKQK